MEATAAAAVEASTTMEAAATYCTAAGKPATSAIACTSVAATISGTIAIAAIAVSAAEPRACSDEEAAVKPRRAIISVRRTSVRGVTVIAPLTYRGAIVAAVPRSDADPERHLSVRVGRRNHQDTKQREIP
jgi:hypothetical protein